MMEISNLAFIVGTFLLLISACPTLQQQHEDVQMIFVGLADSKAYFTADFQHHFIGSMDLCHIKGMVPGSIESQKENDLVVNFWTNINNYLPEPRLFWLTATDHDEEGNYRWIGSKEEVSYSNWGDDGSPSMNTSVNCLIVNAGGEWIESECNENITRYPLCEMQKYKTTTILPTFMEPKKPQKSGGGGGGLEKLKELMQDETMITIGPVGNKYFVVEDALDREAVENHFFEVMDVCHEKGLQLAQPDNEEEHTFLTNFVMQNFLGNPKRPYLYTVAVTDMLSYNCLSSNAQFRGFYSGEQFVKNLNGNYWRYKCGFLTPGGVDSRDCDGPWSPYMCQLIV